MVKGSAPMRNIKEEPRAKIIKEDPVPANLYVLICTLICLIWFKSAHPESEIHKKNQESGAKNQG